MARELLTCPAAGTWGTPQRRLHGAVGIVILLLGLVAAPAPAQVKYQLSQTQSWERQSPVDPKTPAGQLQAVRTALASGDSKTARKLATAWIKHYPNNPLLPQAYLLRGDAKVAGGNEYKALFDYEYLIRVYPGSDEFNTGLEREFNIARLYAAGKRRKFLGMRILTASGEAEEIFIRIQERSPGSDLGERASMALSDFYFNRGNMTSAAEAYDLFLVNYPRSQWRERAMLRAIQANLATFKGPPFDPTGLIEARERIRQYQVEFPAAAERIGGDALLVRIDESLAIKDYQRANWYRDHDRRWSAITLYRRLVRDHPRTAAARSAMEELTQLHVAVAPGAGSALYPVTQTAPGTKGPTTGTLLETVP